MIELFRAALRGRLTTTQRLLFGQLVMFTGIAAIFPVVPLYVAHRGGGSFMIVAFVAGPMIANTIVQVPAGRLVDRVGRKPVLLGSRLGFAVVSLLLFLDIGPLWLQAGFRVMQGATGGAYVPALRAALADLTPVDRRGECYAQLQAVEMVGLLIGPLLGGAIALWHDSGIFAASGIGVLLGLGTMIGMDETHNIADRTLAKVERGWWRIRGVLVPALALAAVGSMFSMYDVVWPQYLSVRGYNSFVIGASESAFAIPILLLAAAGGRLSDRSNRRVLVCSGLAVVAICASTYPFMRSIWPILAVGCIEAIAFVVLEPTLFAVISEETPAAARGRAMGIGGLFQFGGSAAGASILGVLYGVGVALPFWGGAGFCLLTAAVCALALPVRRTRHDPNAVGAAIDLEARA